jgi:hypothetical protein
MANARPMPLEAPVTMATWLPSCFSVATTVHLRQRSELLQSEKFAD